MKKKVIYSLIAYLYRLVLPRTSVDLINKKVIEPVPGLIINGVQYFRYVNAEDVPPFRNLNFLNHRQELAMGADREFINQVLDQVTKHIEDKNYSKATTATMVLKDTVNNLTPIEAFYWQAALLYFDPTTENTVEFDMDLNLRKIADFKAFERPGFFLRTLSQDMKKHGVWWYVAGVVIRDSR